MTKTTMTLALSACASLAAACASSSQWNNADALGAEMVEMQVDAGGKVLEVEYHITPDVVPASVRASMDRLHPGGRAVGAEKEYAGSTLYWEVVKEIDGREVEAMFLPDGTLHSEEVEVDAAGVPEAVQQAVRARLAGQVTKWEEIHDGDRQLVEYHAKVTADGKKYKVMVSIAGAVTGVVREVPAEIEVPLQ